MTATLPNKPQNPAEYFTMLRTRYKFVLKRADVLRELRRCGLESESQDWYYQKLIDTGSLKPLRKNSLAERNRFSREDFILILSGLLNGN